MANVLKPEKRAAIVSALVEGNSIRAAARMVGVSKDTVMKLVVDLGAACLRFHDERVRDLSSKRIEVDEIWSFVGAKAKNVPANKAGKWGTGDVWTFTALDAETKLMISFLVANRDIPSATEFMQDVAGRLSNRVQLSTDGNKIYLWAVDAAFGTEVDFAQLIKSYGIPPEAEHRYSPAVCIGCDRQPISGSPNPKYISTSFVERANLSIRMGNRRFTRLTNAFSKKVENHIAAFALFIVHYNFARIHQTLRITPAMAAGISDHVWEISEIVELLNSN